MAKSTKKAEAQGSTPAMQFVLDYLKRHRKAPYADVQAAGKEKGLTIWPILYGKAQLTLGIVRKKRKAKKAGAPMVAATRSVGRPRGRSRKAGAAARLNGLGPALTDLINRVERYQMALEEIGRAVKDAIG